MVAEPVATPVITPLALTVALLVSEDDQTTVLSVAFVGSTVATNCVVAPTPTVATVLFKITLDTAIVPVIVRAQVAVLLPSAVIAVIVAEPADKAVTMPEESTVARKVLEEDHDTVLFVALVGATVAVSCRVSPANKEAVL
jgi:hypothetical protein